jgi:hypothetical protein
MQSDLEQRESGEEIDFQGKYASAIGAIPLFTALFRSHEDSTLSAYLRALTFLWKDLAFSTWQEILYRISDSCQAVYQFVWFTSLFLRPRCPVDDPDRSERGRVGAGFYRAAISQRRAGAGRRH